MKKLILGLSIGLFSYSLSHAQEVKFASNYPTHQVAEASNTAIQLLMLSTSQINPDAYTHTQPSETWLNPIARLLMENMAYPTRGRAYHITGKMYVKIGMNSQGKLQAVAFEESLGQDFEQAISEAIKKIPRSKIKPLALPSTQQLHFVLPISFKE